MDIERGLLRKYRSGLLAWYDFEPRSKGLYIGSENDDVVEALSELRLSFCSMDEIDKFNGKEFMYIVFIESLELSEHIEMVLKKLYGMLCPRGHLILGMNNRLGIKYFCGDYDKYTGESFDSIDDYRTVYSSGMADFVGRSYSEGELRKFLLEAGFRKSRFYSVLSDLKNPSFLFAEDYLPNEELSIRVFPAYNNPKSVFLDERYLYTTLVKEGLFHKLANAYLIDCTLDGEFSDVLHVTSSFDRGKEDALLTMIRQNDVAEKRAGYEEGKLRLKAIAENHKRLQGRGISVIESDFAGDKLSMRYCHAESAHAYLRNLAVTNKAQFLDVFDKFYECIRKSSEPVGEDENGIILKYCYWDMIPLNAFYENGEFVFYDQEFAIENYYLNAVVIRAVDCFGDVLSSSEISDLLKRYQIACNVEKLRLDQAERHAKLIKSKELLAYHNSCRVDSAILHANRQKINFSMDEYKNLFAEIFSDAENVKIILFGTGNFAKRYMQMYHADYPAFAAIDNNPKNQGKDFYGVRVYSPDFLNTLPADEYKVIICIKNFMPVLRQLKNMGVKNYAVFDSSRDYPRKMDVAVVKGKEQSPEERKPFHIGYIAGVFDLFHFGHLNLLRRAKEQCDYLIVGVVSDEGVCKYKKVKPFIPFEERIEVVRGCRYVDRAEKIPPDFGGTKDAWRMYHFDVQFSGSDYEKDAYWLEEKKFLEEHGSTMVFFPYTEQTSSTKIKALINQRLDEK